MSKHDIADTAIGIMDQLEGLHQDDSAVKFIIEQHRFNNGASSFRYCVHQFAEQVESYWDSLTEDECQTIWDAMLWDCEWLPEVMERLQVKHKAWYDATLEQITEVSNELMTDK